MGWLPDHVWFAQKKGVQKGSRKGWIPNHIFYANKQRQTGGKGWIPNHIFYANKQRQSGGKGWIPDHIFYANKQRQSGEKSWVPVVKARIDDPAAIVWVGGLKPGTTYAELKEHGELAGNAKWAKVYSFKGEGTGVIGYSSAEEAELAVSTLNSTKLKGAKLQVDSYLKKNGSKKISGGKASGWRIWGQKRTGMRKVGEPSLVVWIGDIPEGTTYQDLMSHGEQCGVVKWAKVYSGNGKGTGVIGYTKPNEAQLAAKNLDGSILNGATIKADSYEKLNEESKVKLTTPTKATKKVRK